MEKTLTLTIPEILGERTEQRGGDGGLESPLPRRARVVQPLKLSLTDGQLPVDNRRVPIPRGTGRRLTGAALRKLADVYRGFSLYVTRNGSSTRIRDNDIVELEPDTRLVSRDERPEKVVSQPRFGRD